MSQRSCSLCSGRGGQHNKKKSVLSQVGTNKSFNGGMKKKWEQNQRVVGEMIRRRSAQLILYNSYRDRKVICCKCVNGGTDPFCGRVRLSHLSKHCLSLCKLKFVQSHALAVAVSYLEARGDNVHLNIQISAAGADHTVRCWLRMPLAPVFLDWVKGDASCCPFLTCGFLCGLLDWTAASAATALQPVCRWPDIVHDKTSLRASNQRYPCSTPGGFLQKDRDFSGADWFDAYQI